MKRSTRLRSTGFKRAHPAQRQAKQTTCDAMPKPVARAVAALPMARPVPKTQDPVDNAIRQSARGEECTVRIAGVCTFDPEKTIWSHAPLGAAGKGRGLKAFDLCGCYCCTACDAVVDGQAPAPSGVTRAMVLLDWFMGHMRSLVRLRQKGLV